MDLQGNSRRVDKDGNPLPDETAHAPDEMAASDMRRPPSRRRCNDHTRERERRRGRAGQRGPDGVHGTIDLMPGLDVRPEDFDCLFLMAKRDPTQRSSDFVKKIENPTLPQAFELETASPHAAEPGRQPAGSYVLVARLDRDGDAVAQIGDVQGVVQHARGRRADRRWRSCSTRC